jgi:L-iditol 2-dehydrogenase
VDAAVGSLLETLGVALHAVDLAKPRVGDSAAVVGAGPVGLLITGLLHLAGVRPLYVFDPVANRRERAQRMGATAAWSVPANQEAALMPLMQATKTRGCDITLEVANADRSVDLAFEAARCGGRTVLVGIPPHDHCEFGHSTPRRKGLTVRFARRMKHTYPRALALAVHPVFGPWLRELVTHRFSLAEATNAFTLAHSYQDDVIKAVIEPQR